VVGSGGGSLRERSTSLFTGTITRKKITAAMIRNETSELRNSP
jgi:hypothetical protein